MFRGKKSSNRIELSWLVQKLLNFAVLGSLRLWGWAGWVDGGMGWLGDAPHTRTHARACTHAHARTCMRGKHDNSMQMAASIGFWEFPGNSLWCHMFVCVRACACVRTRMCARVGGAPTHHPTPPSTHPPTPQGGNPRNQSKFNSTWTNRDISIPFEDLKSVETSPPMGGCIDWWVGGWVGGLMGGVRSKH